MSNHSLVVLNFVFRTALNLVFCGQTGLKHVVRAGK